MSASMTLRIRLGPLVFFEVEGENCQEITAALDGFEELNSTVDEMFSDLAERVYAEGAYPSGVGLDLEPDEVPPRAGQSRNSQPRKGQSRKGQSRKSHSDSGDERRPDDKGKG